MKDRFRRYATNPVVLGGVAVAIAFLVLSAVTGNRWFLLGSRLAFLGMVITLAIGGMRAQGEAAVEVMPERKAEIQREVSQATRRYFTRIGLFAIAGIVLAASVYDDFKLWRAIF